MIMSRIFENWSLFVFSVYFLTRFFVFGTPLRPLSPCRPAGAIEGARTPAVTWTCSFDLPREKRYGSRNLADGVLFIDSIHRNAQKGRPFEI